ncbi:hypothetical protein DEO72_LG7g895 [Vigna unguiculata]|nr:hypothetical protein DEO72_LG2g2930 [Vigna unguiculata]QCD99610.1 hypothetical protein DEO72_LG7g894 [Vigna unguiculata]QCD99611.1 hypothetical protein DEO72_LG7g895 [Vigna unguiculata]
MARTIISNAEFMACTKTRRRAKVGPSTAPSPTTNAPTGASGVGTRPRILVIPPSILFLLLYGIKGKRQRRMIPPLAARPSEARRQKLRGH